MSQQNKRESTALRVLANALQRLGGTGGTDQHLREIFQRSFEFIALIAPDGLVLEANQRALAVFGAPLENCIGTFLWDAPSWAQSAKLRADLRASISAASRGVFVRHEIDAMLSGDPLTIDLSLKPIADSAGAVVLIILEGRDITDRKRSERARHETEERFNRIVAIAADAIISINEEQRITLFNQGAEQMFGYSAYEVMSQPLDLLLPPELAAVHRREVDNFAASPTVSRRMGERRDLFGRRKNGEVFRADASISRVVVNGKPVFTAVVRDVTERWAREEERGHLLAAADAARDEAERARERMTLLAEISAGMSESLERDRALHSLAGILVPALGTACFVDVVNSDGRVRRLVTRHASRDMRNVMEHLESIPLEWDRPFTSRQALQRREAELLPAVSDDWLRSVAQDEQHFSSLRALHIRSAIIAPLLHGGEALGAVSVFRDEVEPAFETDDLRFMQEVARRASLAIENTRLYERSQRATAQRDQVLGMVSHDLRNPLSAIAMCATSMKDTPDMDPRFEEQLGTIEESVRLMNRLIEDLLDLSSIEAGKLSISPARVDLGTVATRAVQLFEEAANGKQLHLRRDVRSAFPAVRADADRLQQAVGNLVSNAIKFTPNGGSITVGVDAEPDALVLSVSDTGVGIPEDDLGNVFDRYWHRRQGTAARGNGLGLAITRGIVEAQGGRIWVESTLGQGTVFRFTVPLADAPPASRPEPARSERSAR